MKANQFYCVKCRKPVKGDKVKNQKDRNGRPRLAGKCAVCETKVFRYVKME